MLVVIYDAEVGDGMEVGTQQLMGMADQVQNYRLHI